MQQASQYPGQERKVFEFYQKNPQHLEELRGPILEEKAVDFIIGKSKLTERKVTREELMSETEESDSSEEKSKKKAAGKPKKKAANE
jgi:trigger factor